VILVWSLPTQAQKPTVPVIGFLTTASSASRGGEQLAAFHSGLRQTGYSESENVRIEYRWANSDYSQLRVLANELVALKVKVIVAAGGHVSAMAAHEATKEIPISFTTVTDPVKLGLVKSLNMPGGNATGTAGLTSELDPKRLEFLREAKPSTALVGVLANPNRLGLESQLAELNAAAKRMGVVLVTHKAASDDEMRTAFGAFAAQRPDALLVTADPFFNNRRSLVLSLVASQLLPAIFQWREFVTAGGLMSYGPSIAEAYRQAGINAGLMLHGTKPADIPVVQPTRFHLTVNRTTAKRLSLALPPSILALADEVIE
jgi:putative tryptophan/tyrosine transport system substrate-binding protein